MADTKDPGYYLRLPYARRVEPRTDADGASYFLARIAEIPFIRAEGSTPEEALRHLEESFEDCLQAMLDLGDEIPEPEGAAVR
jgi:predicted RNase H-like HicB family nuclease